ncbi:MAG: response regulator, partial [Desulfatitalea sp.]|nr:response regulator [Desulfatitalea sp.]NNJ99471.1 response regulator [Desulfatitalea sp.]
MATAGDDMGVAEEHVEKHKIMVVDDEPAILRMMQRILTRSGFTVHTADSGLSAISEITEFDPDLIIIDYMMPKLDGFQIIRRLKGDVKWRNVPVIMMTAYDSTQNHVQAFDYGADEFLPKTTNPTEIVTRIKYHIKVKKNNDQLLNSKQDLEKIVSMRTDQLRAASDEIIWRLAAASGYRDTETGTHIRRMAEYAGIIADAMSNPKNVVQSIRSAAPMHDIGKIGIPDQILLKPGKLAPQEWQIMKLHTTIGAKILEGSNIGVIRLG